MHGSIDIGAGTIFLLAEQTLNDFLAGEAKIGEKQSRQSNSKYNFLRYVLFEKGIRSAQWALGLSPEDGGVFRIFVLKVTLQSVRLLSTVSYRKKLGSTINTMGIQQR